MPAVQEVILPVPHAYASLKFTVAPRFCTSRARAVQQPDRESRPSIRSIREGQFLNALIREESREDETWSSAYAICPMRRKLTT